MREQGYIDRKGRLKNTRGLACRLAAQERAILKIDLTKPAKRTKTKTKRTTVRIAIRTKVKLGPKPQTRQQDRLNVGGVLMTRTAIANELDQLLHEVETP